MNNCQIKRLATPDELINVEHLIHHYYHDKPDIEAPEQRVIFGTSGHRGTAAKSTFNEAHILAIAQAIVDYRQMQQITGPCFIGKDTHALSQPALQTVLEVLTANHIDCIIANDWGYTPTPVISHAILKYNRDKSATHFADGIVITPSHNPPEDGGIKYNGYHGGPADTQATKQIQQHANQLLHQQLQGVKRWTFEQAMRSGYVHMKEYEHDYIADLDTVIDFAPIRSGSLHIGVDPLGGASVHYWPRIAEHYGLNINVVNDKIDPTFSFMPRDHDNVIRMDCSSAYAMAGILQQKDRYDLVFGNDTDADRHGIATPRGLMKPNDFLASCVSYLYQNRPAWKETLAIGKTLVTSGMIDRIAHALGRHYQEYPVGFKWYTQGLYHGSLGFAGEESAGASFLRLDGKTWTTDKDGILLCLLAAEMTGRLEKDPHTYYQELTDKLGQAHYTRVQVAIDYQQKQKLAQLNASQIKQSQLAGETITQIITHAPANNESIGGLKVQTANSWFAARLSGTENAYRIYAESFIDETHLHAIIDEATQLVDAVLNEQ